jgi:ligand-binding SRPBCC domain-containing protein
MKVVEQESTLAAPPEAVWARVSTFEGINDELRPLMRMTAPARVRALDPSQVVLGECIFRSWILLFGVIPIDYDDLSLIALEPGRGFHERSTMLSMRAWEHERWLEPDGDGRCQLRDRLSFEPRVGFAGPVLERFIRMTFRHRHKRLVRYFGGEPVA